MTTLIRIQHTPAYFRISDADDIMDWPWPLYIQSASYISTYVSRINFQNCIPYC